MQDSMLSPPSELTSSVMHGLSACCRSTFMSGASALTGKAGGSLSALSPCEDALYMRQIMP